MKVLQLSWTYSTSVPPGSAAHICSIGGHLQVGGSGGTLKYLDISENNYPKNQKNLVGKTVFQGFFFSSECNMLLYRRKVPTSVKKRSSVALTCCSTISPSSNCEKQLPGCRMGRPRDSWSAVNSAQTLPDWENKSEWKMKKTLLQALKTLKTPRLLAMKNRACVNVWPNVAAAPLPPSGRSIAHSARSSHDYLHTDTSRLCGTLVFAHQGQRCRSNHNL